MASLPGVDSILRKHFLCSSIQSSSSSVKVLGNWNNPVTSSGSASYSSSLVISTTSAINNSNIRDHRSSVTVKNIKVMKKYEILQELSKCDIQTQSKQTLLGKWCWWICTVQGCLKLSTVKITISAKSNKMKYEVKKKFVSMERS